MINLKPFNKFTSLNFERPTENLSHAFKAWNSDLFPMETHALCQLPSVPLLLAFSPKHPNIKTGSSNDLTGEEYMSVQFPDLNY